MLDTFIMFFTLLPIIGIVLILILATGCVMLLWLERKIDLVIALAGVSTILSMLSVFFIKVVIPIVESGIKL